MNKLKLNSIKEVNDPTNEDITPINEEETDEKLDKDSIDSDIMKDLQAYRKEQEIQKLKGEVNEIHSSDESLTNSH